MRLDWVADNLDRILMMTWAHVKVSVLPILLSLLISVPIAWWAHRRKGARRILVPISSVLYALPSLPLFVLLPVILGTKVLDPMNLVIALTLYGIALLVRNAVDAFDSVGRIIRDDALAVGHSPSQVFWRVALPLAGPPLLAGTRVVSASTLSLVSVGALIGVPSLGYFFTNGYQRAFPTEILTGVIGTVILAVIFDGIIVIAGRLLMPWVRATDRRRA
ncbi:MAG: ABC transporter permease subunit [Propionibacteriaceae bacterium]|nr:ABC transporter permease subunit [Propionibacteriaceae bacterium]